MSLRASKCSTSPRACSGDIYPGVPITVPCPVITETSVASLALAVCFVFSKIVASGSASRTPRETSSRRIFARPQSITRTSPKGPTMMFAGFRSRWRTPRALANATAFDKFHGVENAAVRECSDVVHGHDAGMFETREDTRFADQTIGEIACGSREIQNFQRHAPLKPFILRGVHDAHAAARDAVQQAVVRAGEVGQVRGVAQAFEGAIGKKFHFASQPKAARASRWNSSSLPQSSRRRSSAIFRNSRRAHASALVTSVKGMPYSFESCS